ncbi:hypothetical protein [Catellatospora coxensis]|uniref:Uncharacterized protein n=1 Tax=Catellatospora coxensis TaxID=310354 RepID=A0A8J3KZY8_9ACTN|nr:hypothetical protein [Catellatospora coxensis]GIG04200.1 hypothetical protein Cco03nite_09000 [Catellatospora coxensis]
MSDLIAALLADFDLLPFYRDRVRLLSRHARDLAGTAEFAELLAELSAGNRVQREMALFMATVAGHRPVIEAALTDPDQSLRSAAVTAWLRDDARTADELWEWLADAPANLRRKAFRVLRADRLSTLADGVIDRVRARYGDVEAASLLPTCGGETVRRQLPVLGHAVGNWAALGRWHPDPVLSWVDDQLREAGPDGERCWWRYGPGIWAAARRLPEKVLDLLEAHAPGTHLPGDLTSYGVLADVDPHRVLALLTAPDRADWTSRGRLPRALLRRFALLDVDDLAELARRLRVDRAGTALPVLLNAVAPRHRERLYDAAYEGAEQSLGMLSDQVLDVLPHRRRVVEAQRMLGLAEARADERVTLRLTAFLPWEQAQPALAAGTRAAEADDRAYAYRLLVGCAPRSRDAAAVTGSVEFLRRLRNEQDPVRRQALDALARVNPLLVDAAAVEALDQIVTDATQARDGSGPTRDALKRLAVNVLQCHTDTPELSRWAQRTLGRLFGDDRLPSLYGLHRQLRRGQEEQFFAAVRDWVVAAVARGGHGPLFAVAEGLGPRAWRLPELQEMLENSINAGNVSGVLSRAVTLWLDDPKTRPARVEQVLRWDTSTVTIPRVWDTLCVSRTDLLDLVIGDEPPAGRFLAAGPRWVPGHAYGLQRWLPRHLRRYAELLKRIANDAGAAEHTRAGAIRQAAHLPDAGRPIVDRYLGSPNTVLAEAALHALVWAGRPAEALPFLLSYADDDKARVAIYSVGSAAAMLAPSELGPLLAAALDGAKVTSRKEILRLAARFAVPGADDLLLAHWHRPGQHRDVRAAIVSSARQHLASAQSWQILTEAVAGGREDALAVLAADPYAVAEEHRLRYGALVTACCLSPDAVVARAAWAALLRWGRWTPEADEAALTRLTDLADRDTWQVVAAALVTLTELGRGAPVLRRLLPRLVELDRADDDGDPEHDRAARRRIEHLVHVLTTGRRWPVTEATSALLVELGGELMRHEDHVDSGARLMLHPALRTPDLLLPVLDDLAARLRDRPAAVVGIGGRLQASVSLEQGWDAGTVLAVGRELAGRANFASGRFAVALAVGGARDGWPAPWRSLVLRLRRHELADVRAAAFGVDLTA